MPSERVQEARQRVLSCGGINWRTDTNAAMDALIAAVRAEVLAEVRKKVQRYAEEGCGCGCEADEHADTFNAILAALAQLEAK